MLAGLNDPVTLRLFYSRKLGAAVPAYGAYADRVREMLQQYAAVANGKVRLEYLRSGAVQHTEDRALAYGLQGVPVDQSGEQVYFGLAGTNLLDDERTIGFFQPERAPFLEYDLTKLVYELSNPQRPVVGVMSALKLDGDPRLMMMNQGRPGGAGQPYASTTLLRQTNDVRTVPTDAQVIDPAIQVLLVAEVPDISAATQYAIDQFVMRGGRLMVMVDPWSEAMAAAPSPTGLPPDDTSSDLPALFKAWGIEFDPTTVVGDLDTARGGCGPGQPTGCRRSTTLPGSTSVTASTTTIRRPPICSRSASPPPASSPRRRGPTSTFTPLLISGLQTGLLPADEVRMPDPAKILAGFKPSGGPRVIAARVRGVLKSAFTGPPPLAAGQQRPANFPAYIAATKAPANLVVVADSDILDDRFWVRIQDFFGQSQAVPFSDNGPFVANLIDTLAGGDALIGLRARGVSARPFVLVNQMQNEAEARFRQTEQTLQQHLEAVQKQLQTLRQGNNGQGNNGQGSNDQSGDQSVQPVITPAQRSAIDAARQDVLATRQKLRAVQYRPEPRHRTAGDRAAAVRHRSDPGAADTAGDRARHCPPPAPGAGLGTRTQDIGAPWVGAAGMRTRSLAALCVLGAASLAGGWFFGTAREPAEQTTIANGTLMFPGLTARLGDAARIEITHQGSTIALVRLGDKPGSPWGLVQRDRYPVQTTKLRAMLTALTELRLVEPRTTDPALFGRLGLADAEQKDSTADLLRMLRQDGHADRRAAGRSSPGAHRGQCARPGLRAPARGDADLAGRGQPAGGRRSATVARSRSHEHRPRAHRQRGGAPRRRRAGFHRPGRQAATDRAGQCAEAG